ncbi:MAG: AMP-binding protein [Rhodospirillaceae bacterium]|nr:AMP-binding protein [Rhodospirillaceae bacterium]
MANNSVTGDSFSPDYEGFVATFEPADITDLLAGDLESGINVCYEACDRWAEFDRVALNWEGNDGDSTSLNFDELQESVARFANFLIARGVEPGDQVACMLPRIPELFIVALGTWRAGAVYVPLFTAFGPKAIEYRLERSAAKLVVTDAINRPKLDEIADAPPVMLVTRSAGEDVRVGDIDFAQAMSEQPTDFGPVMLTGEDPFIMMFTSGTVGSAKGVKVPVRALADIIVYMRYGIGLRDDDRFWNMADPGWAYGLFYAVVGPLVLGQTTHFYEGAFSPESCYQMFEQYGITALVSAPTAYRMMMAAGDELADACDCRLRVACSGGEPLNPEVISWISEHLGCRVGDHYGQTEVGMVICNHHGLSHAMRLGSMGRAVPGFRMVILDENFEEVAPGGSGQIAIDIANSPLYHFQGYQGGAESPLHGDYFLTGDTAELGLDGIFTFMGRADDVILSAGYRIGPFDVESCLIEHPAVVESAVIGKPDEERGEIVKAFVVLRAGYNGSPQQADELRQLVRRRLSSHSYPREIEFVDALPKTPSGKVQRFILRSKEVGR